MYIFDFVDNWYYVLMIKSLSNYFFILIGVRVMYCFILFYCVFFIVGGR